MADTNSSTKKFAPVIAAIAIAGIAAVAIGAHNGQSSKSSAAPATAAPNDHVVHIGYQKFGTLTILKTRGELEKDYAKLGYTVQWSQFTAGPQLLEGLNTGNIEIGHAGETPPIFAQAAGVPLVYVGNERPSPKGEAILVPQNSAIKTLADLKGKRVVLNKGSNVHYLLVQALAKAGLKYSDIEVHYLPPADARAAFEHGSADAWVIWDPYFAAAEAQLHARILVDGTGLVNNREFYLASSTFANTHPDLIKTLLKDLSDTDAWAATHQHDVAVQLAPELGIPVDVLDQVAARRVYGADPISPAVINDQQKIADAFQKLGLIPKQIAVKDAFWSASTRQASAR